MGLMFNDLPRSVGVCSYTVCSAENYDETGALAFSYDKEHLTDAEATDLGLTPGSVPATFEHGGDPILLCNVLRSLLPRTFRGPRRAGR